MLPYSPTPRTIKFRIDIPYSLLLLNSQSSEALLPTDTLLLLTPTTGLSQESLDNLILWAEFADDKTLLDTNLKERFAAFVLLELSKKFALEKGLFC